MLVLPLIPFFLGYNREVIHNSTPSYFFRVRVDTLFINKSETLISKEGNAGLDFYLKCQSHEDNLKCHIPKRKSYQPPTNHVHMLRNNFFTPSSLKFKGIRYRMQFDFKGATSYIFLKNVKNVKKKNILLKVYRFIGDQLSIGADLRTRGFEFNATEKTVIGKCPTHYKISRNKTVSTSELELVSFLKNYKLNKDIMFIINKQRRVGKCQPQKKYILGRVLWSDLITSKVTAKLQSSRSEMKFTQNDFHSMTANMFYLYNKQDEIAGYVRETINVELDFIEDFIED
ncbi:uncharacterized protein LOC116845114 isoform X1 [Odontomachus brunneus]|uniref:uncharacterized protein LOC116845114 isoform X1 n=1 Tax=Odontomachus brunneus TaxID=486640 RepID=UPI0013F19565|nr:uncharacterized protein LOC116845114 isoform X1 [Odontomachus brunneus]